MSGSVQRALQILVQLADSPATISDLGRSLGVHRATALRLLRTLEEERFVRRATDGRYHLGPRMRTLAHAAVEGHDLPTAAAEHLRALGEKCGQTVHLAGLEDDVVVYLDKVESRHAIRMYSRIGAVAPPHATGVGKAILALVSADERDRMLGEEPYRRCTPRTRTDRRELDEELDRIRDRGWALDDFEHEEFIHCVAAPVRSATGAVCGAVSVSTPRMVVDRDELLALVPDVMATADAVSAELGWVNDDAGRR